jgi:hypothetical protein
MEGMLLRHTKKQVLKVCLGVMYGKLQNEQMFSGLPTPDILQRGCHVGSGPQAASSPRQQSRGIKNP